jgi:hypothetical protein
MRCGGVCTPLERSLLSVRTVAVVVRAFIINHILILPGLLGSSYIECGSKSSRPPVGDKEIMPLFSYLFTSFHYLQKARTQGFLLKTHCAQPYVLFVGCLIFLSLKSKNSIPYKVWFLSSRDVSVAVTIMKGGVMDLCTSSFVYC